MEDIKPNRLCNIYDTEEKKRGTGFAGNVWDTDAVSPCLSTMSGGNQEPLVYDSQNRYIREDGCVGALQTDGSSEKHNSRLIYPFEIEEKTRAGYAVAVDGVAVNCGRPTDKNRRARVGKQCANTLDTSSNMGVVVKESESGSHTYRADGYRIRRLTPRECWRLMGVRDEDFDKVRPHQADSSLYHEAGDAIVVNCLMAIFKEML